MAAKPKRKPKIAANDETPAKFVMNREVKNVRSEFTNLIEDVGYALACAVVRLIDNHCAYPVGTKLAALIKSGDFEDWVSSWPQSRDNLSEALLDTMSNVTGGINTPDKALLTPALVTILTSRLQESITNEDNGDIWSDLAMGLTRFVSDLFAIDDELQNRLSSDLLYRPSLDYPLPEHKSIAEEVAHNIIGSMCEQMLLIMCDYLWCFHYSFTEPSNMPSEEVEANPNFLALISFSRSLAASNRVALNAKISQHNHGGSEHTRRFSAGRNHIVGVPLFKYGPQTDVLRLCEMLDALAITVLAQFGCINLITDTARHDASVVLSTARGLSDTTISAALMNAADGPLSEDEQRQLEILENTLATDMPVIEAEGESTGFVEPEKRPTVAGTRTKQ